MRSPAAGPLIRQTPRGERLIALLALALFALLLAVLLGRHEMWRDELQAWMLARDSESVTELWRNARYEGHPLLWHLLLMAPAHLLGAPAAMQGLHWLIATAAAGVLLMKAPFPMPLRAGLAFSYLPLYEYGVISRNYALTVLGLWIVAAALASRRSPWAVVGAGVLVANSSPIGTILAPAIGAAIALTPAWRRRLAAPLAAFAVGVAAAVAQCLPPPDYEHVRAWALGWDLERVAYVLRGFAVALFPVPGAGPNFWGSSLVLPAWPFPPGSTGGIAALAGAAVAAVTIVAARALRSSPRALAAWLVGAAALVGFTYVKLAGAIRHHGFLWVLLVACMWVGVSDATIGRRRAAWLLAPCLAAGLWAAMVAGWHDWSAEFSGARSMARQVADARWDTLPIVGGVDYATSGVAGYLPAGRLYYPASGLEGSFVVWNLARLRQDTLTHAEIVNAALARDRGEGVVLLLNAPMDAAAGSACLEVASTGPAIVSDERLWAYLCGVSVVGAR